MKKRGQILLTSMLIVFLFLSLVPYQVQAETKEFTEYRPNVIFMIGDGMGIQQLRAASLVEFGAENQTVMDLEFERYDTYTTLAIDGSITDSAAGGTALATGQKTENTKISQDPEDTYYMKTLLEYLEYDFGYASGLVSTTHIGHATPASFAAHAADRDYYDEIYPQMMSKGIEVLLGGGLQFEQFGEDGARLAGQNNGYDLAFDRDTLLELTPTSDKLLGVFGHQSGETHLPYEDERDPTIDPSLLEMTESAITILDRHEDPFFLMVEGGKIDRAGHLSGYNNATTSDKTIKMILQTIVFEQSVRAALEFAKTDGNTIVVVAADHETGGFEVLGPGTLDDTLPSDSNTYEENMAIRMKRSLQLNSSFLWNAHTNDPVPFYGYGGDFGDFPIEHNVDVFFAINHALGSFPVPTSYSYREIGGNFQIQLDGIDLDQTISSYEIVTTYSDGTEDRIEKTLSLDSVEFSILENITLPTGDFEVYIHLKDNDQLSVNSFSDKHTLTRQDVVYNIPFPETTSDSVEESTNSQPSSETQETPLLSIIGTTISLTVLIGLKRPSSRITSSL